MKKVLTVQDISCLGKCSLTVALPIISAMGIETCIIPTAVLSTHTAFSDFTFTNLTSNIQPILDHWEKEQVHFDSIYTGYLGSIEQIEIIKNLINKFGKKDTLTIIDPCMADNGKLYTGFDKTFAAKMAELCAMADVITPNLTEVAFLLNIPYISEGYNQEYIQDLLLKLSETGAKKIVLKGVQYGKDERTGIVAYDSTSKKFSQYFHKKLPVNFHGTGDIFVSVLTGGLTKGMTLEESFTLAADFVVQAIKETLSHPDYNWYGVDFESVLPFLFSKTNVNL